MNESTPGSDLALPRHAATLGYAGLAPFVACALLLLWQPDAAMRELTGRVLVGYGAAILSFLGGVHWGLVLRASPSRGPGMLAVGVLPALAGWLALLLSLENAIVVQVAGFGVFWLYEHRVLGPAIIPSAYLALRRWLTLVACASLALALMAPALVPTRF